MHTRFWRCWLTVGLAVVVAALTAGLMLGLLQEVVILLATVGACSLCLLPTIVDPPGRPSRSAAAGRPRWSGRQEA